MECLTEAVTLDLCSEVGDVCLADLDDRGVRLDSLRGRAVVLIGGGKGSMEQAVRWGARLSHGLTTLPGVLVLAVAFIHPEPSRLIRQVVRRAIKHLAPLEPLMDWDGSAARALGLCRTDVAHLWLIDRACVLRARVVGDCSDSALEWVRERMTRLAEAPFGV